MMAVVQTVFDASVTVNGDVVGQIDKGMLVYFGLSASDKIEDVPRFLDKVLRLRIFKDENDKMNLDVSSVGGKILFVSQFTLYADVRKGNRPGFDGAMRGSDAKPIYDFAVNYLRDKGLVVETGRFGAMMEVSYVNDGPETFIVDSEKIFRNF